MTGKRIVNQRAVDNRIVVIGAGAAGLAAARALQRRGHDVLVLEARARIGGRILTRHARVAPAPIELGAEFVHGAAPETMRIARAAGLHVTPSGERATMWTADRGTVTPGGFGEALERVFGLLDPTAPDESFAQFLSRNPGGRALAGARASAASFVRGFHAADTAEIGVRAIVEAQEETGAASRITQGQSAIPDSLAQDLGNAIRTRAVVSRIRWKRHGAVVDLRDGSRVRARAVIVTVPLGVLQAKRGGIAFDPEPASALHAASKLAMGSVTKVVFAFDSLPWPKDIGFLLTPGSEFGVWWASTPPASRAPLAVAWSGGPAAAELDRLPAREIIATAVRDLSRAIGMPRARLAGSVRGAWVHDWQHDPFSRGAYSYPRFGGAHAGRALARPVEETLFFAGEATSEAWGTVEGALASGLRAVRQVDAALRA